MISSPTTPLAAESPRLRRDAAVRGARRRRARRAAALRADADAASHAQRHLAEGVAALQGEGGASAADLSVAERHFSIAACIVPNHAETAEALRVVREALAS